MLVVWMCIGLVSCTDILDLKPLEAPEDKSFFSTREELTLALNGAYRSLYWLSNDNVPYQLFVEGATDLVYIRGDFANMTTVQAGQATASTSVFQGVWETFYSNIARCNNLLANMVRAKENVDETFYQQVEAQAKFLRAYNYFYLTSLYSDVPFVTEPLDWRNPNIPKTARRDIVNQLYEDLGFAKDHLPWQWQGAEYGHVTKGAALGLKARIALINGDYEIARDAADSVIQSGEYAIYPSYEKLFRHSGSMASEIMLFMPFLAGIQTNQIPRYIGTRGAPGYSVIVPTQTLVDMYRCVDGKNIAESPLYDPTHPFENRDPRLDYSILRPGMWHGGYKFETHPDSIKTSAVVNGDTVRINNLEATNAYATFTGYIEKKYYDEADLPENVTRSELDFILMRYAEILLTYAEAKIELGELDASVEKAMNEVRQREDVDMPPVALTDIETMRALVRSERTIELAMEGLRLFDIRRWEIAEHVMPGYILGKRTKPAWYTPLVPSFTAYGKPVYPDEGLFQKLGYATFNPDADYAWPIPQTEIDRNPLLKN